MNLPLSNATLGKIDVHAHYVPDVYRRAAEAAGHAKPDGMPVIPAWHPTLALDAMDRIGVSCAVLSISSPGVWFGDESAACSLARAVNDEGARLVATYPKRFGLFATLPLPNMDNALSELTYAFDQLHADGIVLMTHYGGVHLGHQCFEPLFAELNRRHSLVFIHPTSPSCPACTGELRYPGPMLEFMFETTRTICHLILTGTLRRFPNIRIIVPHAGAAIPALSDRVAGMTPLLELPQAMKPDEFLSELRRLYFDLAGHAVPNMIDSLLRITDVQHLLYGSDWPYTPLPVTMKFANLIDSTTQFAAEDRGHIYNRTALSLLPRLKALWNS